MLLHCHPVIAVQVSHADWEPYPNGSHLHQTAPCEVQQILLLLHHDLKTVAVWKTIVYGGAGGMVKQEYKASYHCIDLVYQEMN